MKRRFRIVLEVLGPPLLGGLLLGGIMLGHDLMAGDRGPKNTIEVLADSAVAGAYILGVAYLVAGIPSLIYAAIMEICFARGVSPKNWRSVWLSAGLGTSAGVGMVTVLNLRGIEPLMILLWAATGLIIGGALGLIIRHLSKPGEEHP